MIPLLQRNFTAMIKLFQWNCRIKGSTTKQYLQIYYGSNIVQECDIVWWMAQKLSIFKSNYIYLKSITHCIYTRYRFIYIYISTARCIQCFQRGIECFDDFITKFGNQTANIFDKLTSLMTKFSIIYKYKN